jgi:hypothetical protein
VKATAAKPIWAADKALARRILHRPDPELGEQLIADTLGVADRDAMHGILRQLVKASVKGAKPDGRFTTTAIAERNPLSSTAAAD